MVFGMLWCVSAVVTRVRLLRPIIRTLRQHFGLLTCIRPVDGQQLLQKDTEPRVTMNHVLVIVEDTLPVSWVGDWVPENWDRNILPIYDIALRGLKEIESVGVEAEEVASSDTATLPHPLRCDPGQRLRPKEPQLASLAVVFLKKFVLILLAVTSTGVTCTG